MKNTDIIEKCRREAIFPKLHGKIGIFADAHFGEAAHFFEGGFPHAHVETARLKFGYGFFAAADAARGKNGGHGIGYGFLHEVEPFVRFVGATKSVAGNCRNVFFDVLNIIAFYNHIGIDENKPVAFCSAGTVVSG